MQILWLLSGFLFSILAISIKCDDAEYKLIHSILKNYDSSIRPSDHHNSTLNVTFGLALTQLIDVVFIKLLNLVKKFFYYLI